MLWGEGLGQQDFLCYGALVHLCFVFVPSWLVHLTGKLCGSEGQGSTWKIIRYEVLQLGSLGLIYVACGKFDVGCPGSWVVCASVCLSVKWDQEQEPPKPKGNRVD